jgi:hypothetical protein
MASMRRQSLRGDTAGLIQLVCREEHGLLQRGEEALVGLRVLDRGHLSLGVGADDNLPRAARGNGDRQEGREAWR